ncbi:MAG: PorT family protein [Cyclobacteriaceae bacterium]
MLKNVILIVFSLFAISANAQYWFGPKVGLHRNDFIYQESNYKSDSFDVKSNYNGQYGVVLVYQATEKYAVHGELYYERLNKKVTNKDGSDIPVYSKTNFNYLSLPFSLRWNFGREPTHFYIAGGPKLSLWLGGSGEILLDEFSEDKTVEGPLDYKMRFTSNRSDRGNNYRTIAEANILQYGLQVSSGVYFDVVSGGRVLLDVRYSFGHSNMGFNNNPDFSFDEYTEDWEFRNYTLSVSLAYLFEYNVALQRKGASTNKISKKSKR